MTESTNEKWKVRVVEKGRKIHGKNVEKDLKTCGITRRPGTQPGWHDDGGKALRRTMKSRTHASHGASGLTHIIIIIH